MAFSHSDKIINIQDQTPDIQENTPLLQATHDQTNYATLPQPVVTTNPDTNFKKKLIPAAVIASLHASNLGFSALGAPTNTPTKNYNLEWFESLSASEQANAIMSALSAFSVNAVMFTRINLKAVENILKGLKENRLLSAIYTLLSAYGGFPMFAIAVAGYLWAPAGIGHFFGILSYLNTATSRFTGLMDLTQSVRDQFNIDVKLQKKAIDKLKHIKPDPALHQEIDDFLKDKILDHQTFIDLMSFLDQKGEANVFDKKTKLESVKEFGEMSHDVLLGCTVALVGFVIYNQKTIDGLIEFEKLFREHSTIDEWEKGAQFVLGLPGGILSAIFYSKNAVQIREVALKTLNVMIDHARHFSEHKAQSTAVFGSETGLGVLNFYGGNALKSIAQGVIRNPKTIYDGILFPSTTNELSTPYSWLNGAITGLQQGIYNWLPTLGGTTAGIINSVNSFSVFNNYLAPPPAEGKKAPTVKEIIAFEETHPLRDPLYKGQLARLGMFATSNRLTPSSLAPSREPDLTSKMGRLV